MPTLSKIQSPGDGELEKRKRALVNTDDDGGAGASGRIGHLCDDNIHEVGGCEGGGRRSNSNRGPAEEAIQLVTCGEGTEPASNGRGGASAGNGKVAERAGDPNSDQKRSAKNEAPNAKKKRARRDPNAPKGAKNCYNFFASKIRPTLEGGDNVQKELGARWKALSAVEKRPYEDMAAEDKERHRREMEVYEAKRCSAGDGSVPLLSTRRGEASTAASKRRGDPNAPQESDGFLYYWKEMHPRIQGEHQNTKSSHVTKIIRQRWNRLTAEGKQPYEDQKLEGAKRFEEALVAYDIVEKTMIRRDGGEEASKLAEKVIRRAAGDKGGLVNSPQSEQQPWAVNGDIINEKPHQRGGPGIASPPKPPAMKGSDAEPEEIVSDVKDANELLRRSNQDYKERVRALEAELKNQLGQGVSEELGASKAAFRKMEEEHTALEGKYKNLQDSFDLKSGEVESLMEELELVNVVLASEKLSLDERIRTSEAERARSDREHQEQLGTCRKMTEEHTALKGMYMDLQRSFHLKSEEVKSLTEGFQIANGGVSALGSENQSLKERICTLEAERTKYDSEHQEQLGALTSENQSLQTSNGEKYKRIHALEAQLEKSIRERKASEAAFREMAEKHTALEDKHEDLETAAKQMNEEGQEYRETMEQLTSEKQTLVRSHKEKEDHIRLLEEQIRRLEEQRENYEREHKEMVSSKAMCKRLESEFNNLQSVAKQKSEEVGLLKKENKISKESIKELMDTNKSLRASNHEKEEQIRFERERSKNGYEEQLVSCKAEFKNLEVRHSRLKSDFNNLRNMSKQQSEEIDALKREAKKYNKLISKLQTFGAEYNDESNLYDHDQPPKEAKSQQIQVDSSSGPKMVLEVKLRNNRECHSSRTKQAKGAIIKQSVAKESERKRNPLESLDGNC